MHDLVFVAALGLLACASTPKKEITPIAATLPPVAVALAPDSTAKMPGVGAEPVVAVPRPIERKLKNGARVWIVERTGLPLVKIDVIWPTGAAAEPRNKAGLASLTANLLDEGAGKWDSLGIAEELGRRGARVGTSADWDGAGMLCLSLTRVLDEVLPIVGAMLSSPRFEASEVERVRKEQITNLTQARDFPSELAQRTIARALYPSHRYEAPILGAEETLSAITRADIVDWYQRVYSPKDATVVVVGDVRADEIVKKLDAAWSGWVSKKKNATAPKAVAPPIAGGARKVLFVDRPGAAQTELRLAEVALPRKHPDYFPVLLANALFGGQFSSRLNLNLREKNGYTYGASSGLAWRRDGGPLVVGAPVKTAVTQAALKETLAELARFRSGIVTEDEVRLSKNLLKRSIGRWFETLVSTAGVFDDLATQGLPIDYYQTYADRIEAVTAVDLARVIAAYIHPDQMIIVGVGDAATVKAGLEAEVGPAMLVKP